MLIDTHAHLNFSAFKDDVDEVIRRTLENDVWVINVGSQYSTSKRAVEIAERYEKGIFAAVGLHPMHLEERKVDVSETDAQAVFKTRAEELNYEKYKELVRRGGGKVVAIGEIGLDYYYKPKTKKKLEKFQERQRETFLKQFNLAQELNLPVILHCRVAHNDLLEVLKSEIRNPKSETNSKSEIPNPKFRGVVHCFTGNSEQAQKFLELGFHLGFNGLIFKEIPGLPSPAEIISQTPLGRILIETDAPYLMPPLPAKVPQAGPVIIQRNEPLNVFYVAQKVAEIKKISFKEIVQITVQNARELFKI